tara:strand:- start:139 stop:1185 length:1047 start_codon:yes stop_codon:yes gene_type:complete
MGVVDQDFTPEFSDMVFNINKKSGTVQIFPRVPLEKLYFKSHGSGKIGATWKKHHEEFYELILPYMNGNIVEIGGGHNSIHMLPGANKEIFKVYSFDPNGKKSQNDNIKIINSFFSKSAIKNENIPNIEMFIHSHLLEHIYDPLDFLKIINENLNRGGMHIFAVPNMSKMIDLNFANAMNFEHPFYLSEDIIEQLLSQSGFEIIEKKYFQEAHSIFYKTIKVDRHEREFENQYVQNKEMFLNLIKKWILDVKNINNILEKYHNEVYIFGAHIFSQNLISNGLNCSKVRGILDNDPSKQGQILYGTKLEVKNPAIILKDKKPLIILRAASYNDEIKDGLKVINPNCYFI